MDLSPIQPQWYVTEFYSLCSLPAPCSPQDRTAPNCRFEVDDFEEEWTYRRQFDYIHAREVEGCVGDADKLFQRAFEHLTPGGYLEIQTVFARFVSDDGSEKKVESAMQWASLISEALIKFGKPWDSAPEWMDKMKAAGFVDVQQDIRKTCHVNFIPVRQHPKAPTDSRHSVLLATGQRTQLSRRLANTSSSSSSRPSIRIRRVSCQTFLAGRTRRSRCLLLRRRRTSRTQKPISTSPSTLSGAGNRDRSGSLSEICRFRPLFLVPGACAKNISFYFINDRSNNACKNAVISNLIHS